MDVPEIEDTLRAPLFAAAQGSVRFAHRALAEFLAARWLVGRRFERQQILSPLVAPDDEEERLVPQLREVAAWTVALEPDLLGDILRHEPDVLLRVERLDLGAEDRHRIVAALLAPEDVAERVALFDRRTRRVLRTLAHPEIAEQLRDVLSDGRAPLAVRQLAVTIAGANTVTELQRDLLLIAIDEREPDHFRAHAIGALDDLADDDVRRTLLPLALEDQPTDRTDEIKGQALEAVCPSVVPAVEVLPSLSAPKDRNLIGSYRMFLRRVVPKALAPEDLPAALKWAAAMRADGALAPALAGLVDAVLARACQHLDRPGMPEALWSVLVPRLRADGDLLSGDDRAAYEEVFRDATKRRRLLPLLAAAVRDDALQPFWAVDSVPRLLSPEDVPWLLERVTGIADRPTRAAYAELLAAAFVPEIADLDVVLTAADGDADLRAAMSPWLGAINLDSEQARYHRRRAERRATAPPDAPDMAKEIETHLARAQDGDLKSWWVLNSTLTFDERGGATVTGELEPDLRKLDGWGLMTAAQHERALAAAKRYVVHAQPEPERWFGTGTIWKPAFAGYRALFLISVVEPAWLDALPPEAWKHWGSIIVGYPLSNSSEDPTHGDILRRALAAAPEEIARWVLRGVDADNERSGTVFGLWRLRDRPASAVVDALACKVEDPSLHPLRDRRSSSSC